MAVRHIVLSENLEAPSRYLNLASGTFSFKKKFNLLDNKIFLLLAIRQVLATSRVMGTRATDPLLSYALGHRK